MNRYALGKTALRDRPEDDYDARALARELESSIRSTWHSLCDYRRRAREETDPYLRHMVREGVVTFRCTLQTLLYIRREARQR